MNLQCDLKKDVKNDHFENPKEQRSISRKGPWKDRGRLIPAGGAGFRLAGGECTSLSTVKHIPTR